MTTAQQVRKELQEELARKGWAIQLLDSGQAHTTYFKPDGEPLVGLPADPFSMQKYLRRGFLLAPPPVPVATLAEKPMVEESIGAVSKTKAPKKSRRKRSKV